MKTSLMALYLMFVLFAYYILKPVSRALLLKNIDIENLPWVYILIASVGGVLAYFYTKLAVRSSLRKAVDFATAFCTGVLIFFWWLIGVKQVWVLYAFNVWVSLFSVMLVSQGWLVAANVFTPREAKRLYGILGVGSVLGAAFGGSFTAWAVHFTGTRNLVLASAGMTILSYIAYRAAIAAANKSLESAKGAEDEPEFSFGEIVGNIVSHRHLQVIIAIITITFIVDVMVEYQFSAMAKQAYTDQTALTAFLGNFFGFWLNLVTFVLQLFLTSFVVSRFGVGGALQIMPSAISLASVAAVISPSLWSMGAARLTEASTRYSFNKTGMELLYLPLPLELRNRTKAFVDVVVDRLARGLGGMILLVLSSTAVLDLDPHQFAWVVLILGMVWIPLAVLAQREYVRTVRKRIETRRFDLETTRVTVREPETVRMLERTARGDNGRQAAFALGLLAEAPGYPIDSLLIELSVSRHASVRGKAYAVAAGAGVGGLRDAAEGEVRNARGADPGPAVAEAVRYLLAISDDKRRVASQLIQHGNAEVRRVAVESLSEYPEVAREVIDRTWLKQAAAAPDPRRRALAALAIRAHGDQGTEALHDLLDDPDRSVAQVAIRTAGALANREYLHALTERLADPRLRGDAIQALAAFGPRIIGSLGDVLADQTAAPAIRRQIPRVLQRVPDQKSVDTLFGAISSTDLILRTNALKALNRLREAAPRLNYGDDSLRTLVHDEARYYFEIHAALKPLRNGGGGRATRLLVRTLEDRLDCTLERVFRLIGLRYPPKQIYGAYIAVRKESGEDHAAALEFLDNTLERELKRVLLPLLDEDAVLAQRGHELFRIEPRTAESALRELIRSEDAWLAACAIAAAAELKSHSLLDEIRAAAVGAGRDVVEVAKRAEAALA